MQFGEKPKSSRQVDVDPLLVREVNPVEPLDVMMVKATECFDREENIVIDNRVLSYVFPRIDEGLLKFLERFQKNNSQVDLCP